MTVLAVASRNPVPGQVFDYEHWIMDVRAIAWYEFTRKGVSIETIAERAGVGIVTTERFIWGETKRPAASTVYNIARALGFRLSPIPLSARYQPDEPDLRHLRPLVRSRA